VREFIAKLIVAAAALLVAWAFVTLAFLAGS
jgi:hypothetical protein